MIRRYRLLVLMLLSMICAACTQTTAVSTDSTAPDNTIVLSEYGHSPFEYPENFIFEYNGGALSIPYVFYGGSVDSKVGLLVFIDGVAQPYGVEDKSSANDYMTEFNIVANSEETHKIDIYPTTGEKGDELRLNFACIDFPEPDKMNETIINYQSISTTMAWTLKYNDNRPTDESPPAGKQAEFVASSIPSEDTDGEDEGTAELEEAQTGRYVFTESGRTPGSYKTIVFIDNKPVLFGDDSFIEYKATGKEDTRIEIELAENELKDAHVIYAISILTSSTTTTRTQMEVLKTNALLLSE